MEMVHFTYIIFDMLTYQELAWVGLIPDRLNQSVLWAEIQ